jgi:hypothetical protein
MLQILQMGIVALEVAAFAICDIQPAAAACRLIKATASAGSKAEAARSSQTLVVQSGYQIMRANRWSYVTLYAHRVKADPFWKAVRPDGPPREAVLKPDIITSNFYTTCFTGVVVPYVCTTGSSVCGQ